MRVLDLHKIWRHGRSLLAGFVISCFTASFLIACSAVNKTTAVQDDNKTDVPSIAWNSKIEIGPPESWPQTIINKCSAEHCRDFATPFGIYKINNPAKAPDIRKHFDFVVKDKNQSDYRTPYLYVAEQERVLKNDMLRAGCIEYIDSYCRLNGQFFEDDCGDDFSFGSAEFSQCERRSLQYLSRTVAEQRQCTVNGVIRQNLGLFKITGSLDEHIDKYFDTQCLGWINSDHIDKLPIFDIKGKR